MNYVFDPLYMIARCTEDIQRIERDKLRQLATESCQWQGVSIDPIPYSVELARMVNKEAVKAFQSPDPLLYQVSPEVIALTGNETKRWICALEGYLSSHKPLISLSTLLSGIMDIDFAVRLKKTRTYAWTRAYSMTPSEDDGLDEYEKIPYEGRLDDLGQIFNYRYWFFWKEEPVDDYKFSSIPVPDIDPELITNFEAAVDFVTPDVVPNVEPETVLVSVSSSGAIAPDGTRSKNWKIKEVEELNSFSSHPLEGHLTLVPKCAGELREAITLSVPQSNSVKLIEKQVAEIAKSTMYSAYGKSPGEFEKTLRDFYKDNSHFLCRDLKKEGITKPRWIIHSILKVFKRKYPECKAWQYSGIFADMVYILPDGKRYPTERGHGLGMANALTTIMQCAAFQVFKWYAEHELILMPDGLFYNDDGVIGSTEELAIIAYEDAEEPLLESMGLLKKNEKTYRGPVGVLCEKYSNPYLDKKESYWRYVRRIPFASPCILVAKESWYLASSPWNGYEVGLLERLRDFWGCEYSMEEWYLPWWAGGWNRPTIYNVDLSFLEVEPTQLLARGYRVGPTKLKPTELKVAKRYYKSPLEYIYGTYDLPESVNRAFGINQPLKAVAAQYSRGGSRRAIEDFLLNQLFIRRNKWATPAKELSLTEYYEGVVTKHPWRDILPPFDLGRFHQKKSVTVYKEGGPTPVKQANPYLGAVSWFHNKYIKHVIPWPEWPGRNVHFQSLSSEQQDFREQTLLDTQSRFWVQEFESPGDVVITRRWWNNDYAVMAAVQSITGEDLTIEPPVLSEGGKINSKEEAELRTLEFHSSPNLFYIWQVWGRTIPILYINNALTDEDIVEICSPLSPITPKGPLAEPWQRPPEFFTWRSCGRPQFEPYNLYHMYNEADSTIVMGETYKMFFTEVALRGQSFKVKPPPVSPVMEHFFETHLKLQKELVGDVYIYRPPDVDVMADVESDEEGVLGGLFG